MPFSDKKIVKHMFTFSNSFWISFALFVLNFFQKPLLSVKNDCFSRKFSNREAINFSYNLEQIGKREVCSFQCLQILHL